MSGVHARSAMEGTFGFHPHPTGKSSRSPLSQKEKCARSCRNITHAPACGGDAFVPNRTLTRKAHTPSAQTSLARFGSHLFNGHDADVVVLTVNRLVAEIKNASCKAKPFCPILDSPDAIGFRQ